MKLFDLVKPYRRKDGPDCIIPFSGGRDSSYGLHLIVKELKMKPITYTYDWGMVTDLGRRNISRMCSELKVENIIVAADISKKRRNIAKIYNEKILNKKIKKLQYSKTCVYHQYVILVKQKRKLIKLLDRKKIQYGFHYNQAIHQLDAFKNYFKNQRFNNAERLAKEGISIPIDPNLSKKNINFIIETLNSL